VAVNSLHCDRAVSVVLVHVTTCFEGDPDNADTGLLDDRLRGVVCRLVRSTGAQ
jgi:hypothetical protein